MSNIHDPVEDDLRKKIDRHRRMYDQARQRQLEESRRKNRVQMYPVLNVVAYALFLESQGEASEGDYQGSDWIHKADDLILEESEFVGQAKELIRWSRSDTYYKSKKSLKTHGRIDFSPSHSIRGDLIPENEIGRFLKLLPDYYYYNRELGYCLDSEWVGSEGEMKEKLFAKVMRIRYKREEFADILLTLRERSGNLLTFFYSYDYVASAISVGDCLSFTGRVLFHEYSLAENNLKATRLGNITIHMNYGKPK